MPTLVPLADAEKLIRGWLASQFPSPIRVVTETPADLGAVPTIVVGRIGGSSPTITIDNARTDITAFDMPHDGLTARENARALAAQVRTALMYHLPGQVAGGGAVQSVTEESAYHFVPYDNTSLRRFEATYRITIHSIPS